ncbi:MAG: c-type cytochrome [Cyclobacteriaceae bacterium]|nr:c-type cytochrome [Cyclobacteriaceae bacterium]
MKRILIILLTMAAALPVAAQDASGAASTDINLLFYITTGFMFVVAILVLFVAVYLLQVINVLAKKVEQERAARQGTAYQPEPGFFDKINNWLNDFVPVEKETTILMDHNYDGIQELDNHLPPWWKWLFYVTIIFSGVYLVAYHISDSLPLPASEYDQEVAYANAQIQKLKAANPAPAIDEANVTVTTDVAALADGKTTFTSICASCHLADGGGDIGPNLTDQYWKHGGSATDLFKVVKNGVQGTNMVAWGSSLSPEKIRNVVSYVLTLQGTTPAKAKAPEGDLYTPQGTTTPADTVKTQASL